MLDGDEWIPAAPEDQRGDHLREVEPVGRVDALPVEVDDRAHGVQERPPRLGVAQGGVAAGHLGQVMAELQSQAAERLPDRLAHAMHTRVGEKRQHQLGSGQRCGPQQRVDLLAQPAAVDEHEALAEHGVLVGGLHGDATAQRMAHHRRPRVAEHDQQVAEADRVRAEGVVAAWLGRLTMAQQVGLPPGSVDAG